MALKPQIWHIDRSCLGLPNYGLPTEVTDRCCADTLRVIERAANYGVDQRTADWHAIRKKLAITGTGLNTIIGANKYETVHGLLAEKLGRKPNPFFGNDATVHGTAYETEALQKVCDMRGVHCFELGLMTHHEFEEFGGSPDGLTEDGWLVEIKCPLRRRIVPGKIPEYYTMQPQFYMWLLDLKRALFVQYRPAMNGRREYVDVTPVERDDAALDSAIAQGHLFAKRLRDIRESGVLPGDLRDFILKEVRESVKPSEERYSLVTGVDVSVEAMLAPEVFERLYLEVKEEDMPVCDGLDDVWNQFLLGE